MQLSNIITLARMNELAELRRLCEQQRDQIARLQTNNEQLTADSEQLQTSIEQLQTNNQQLQTANAELRTQLQQSRDELAALIRRIFGRSSERYIVDAAGQLHLAFDSDDDIEDARSGILQALEEHREQEQQKKRRRRGTRELFPGHLPRHEVLIDLPDDEKEGLTRIGEDVTETLHFRRPVLHVVRRVYPKYVRSGDTRTGVLQAGVVQAPRPASLVSGDRYDTSIAAELITAKYGYHLPVYRQEDMFAGSGVHLPRSTLLNVLSAAALLIRPFIEYLRDAVRRDSCIGTDDTGVCLLLPDVIPSVDPDDPKSRRVHEVIRDAVAAKKKSINAKMWVYRGLHVPLNIFDFTVSRHRDGPDLFLIDNNYEGTLIGDCYGANTGISMRSSGSILHAACNAHARRKFEAALDNHQRHAAYVLETYAALYDIEDQAKGLNAADRLDVRQRRSRPLWDALRNYVDTQMTNVSTKEKIGEARGYLLNQWNGLVRCLDDGQVPIDNNLSEQLMRQVAVGRKNWLFLGSVAAGDRAADLMSLVSSAHRNDLDVWDYVKDVLDQLLSGSTNFASLRPDEWARTHPDSIRNYRQKEREQQAARRDRNRLHRRLHQIKQLPPK
ncbi:MAG: IS66 family transposase [Planctomycetaceae bacterium]